MLGKKLSSGTSSKGRSSLSSVQQTSSASVTTASSLSSSSSKVVIKSTSTNNSNNATAVFQQTGILPPPAVYKTEIMPPPGVTHIKTNENFKMLPRYSAALSRPHDESLPSEELDPIQLELEILLSAVALRYRNLKTEYDSMDRDDKRKKGHDKSSSHSTSSSNKRKRDESNKKSKESSSTKYFAQQPKLSKLKNVSSHSPSHSQHTDDSLDLVPYGAITSHATRISIPVEHVNITAKILLPKNDIPNKFWLSVEPYCMPITQEDIKLLDDLVKEYNAPLVPPIPELGPHYISQWATDDLRDEQDNSNQNAKANKRFTNSTNTDVANMMRKGEKSISDGITGPLTQRLLAAFIEENVMPNVSNAQPIHKTDITDGRSENNRDSNLASNIPNGIEVERRLKKELLDLGFLDMNDFPKEKDDEVLNEIKRVRTELYAIAEYNQNELKVLHGAAKKEMKRLEIKRKLDVIDQEIIEMYKKVWAAKQKRRPLTPIERDDILRLTEEQKRLSDLLESMPMPGFNSTVCSSSI